MQDHCKIAVDSVGQRSNFLNSFRERATCVFRRLRGGLDRARACICSCVLITSVHRLFASCESVQGFPRKLPPGVGPRSNGWFAHNYCTGKLDVLSLSCYCTLVLKSCHFQAGATRMHLVYWSRKSQAAAAKGLMQNNPHEKNSHAPESFAKARRVMRATKSRPILCTQCLDLWACQKSLAFRSKATTTTLDLRLGHLQASATSMGDGASGRKLFQSLWSVHAEVLLQSGYGFHGGGFALLHSLPVLTGMHSSIFVIILQWGELSRCLRWHGS